MSANVVLVCGCAGTNWWKLSSGWTRLALYSSDKSTQSSLRSVLLYSLSLCLCVYVFLACIYNYTAHIILLQYLNLLFTMFIFVGGGECPLLLHAGVARSVQLWLLCSRRYTHHTHTSHSTHTTHHTPYTIHHTQYTPHTAHTPHSTHTTRPCPIMLA